MKIDKKESTVIPNVSEKQAQDEIEKTLEVSVPEFYYMPDGVKFSGYDI